MPQPTRSTGKHTSAAPGGGVLRSSRLTTTRAASATLPETEDGFQQWAIEQAQWRGWMVYHTHDSRRSEPGFPDLVLVRERVLFRECKTDTGSLTPEQSQWLDRLVKAGADASVWRPADRRSIEKELE